MNVTIDNKPVATATLRFPRNGVWTADIDVGSDVQLTVGARATLTVGDVSFTGTVWSTNAGIVGHVAVRIVGGRGGLLRAQTSQSWQGPTVGVVIRDALRSVGEELSSSTSAAVLSRRVNSWLTWAGTTTAQELNRFCTATGLVWRVGSDGTTLISADTAPSSLTLPPGAVVINTSADGSQTFSIPRLTSHIEPGTLHNGWLVEEVVIAVSAQNITLSLWRSPIGTLLTPRSAFTSFGLYPGTVTGQNADGTLVAVLDDTSVRARAVDGLRVWGGTGASWRVTAGARVLVGFEGGDATRGTVVAVAGEPSTLTTLTYGETAGAQFLAMADRVLTELNAVKTQFNSLKSTFDAHIHSTGVGPSGATATPFSITFSPSSVACRRLKSD